MTVRKPAAVRAAGGSVELPERVAVLLCGYGEVEDNHELGAYNEKSLRLLVSKSIKFPDPVIPWMSRLLEIRARREYERANHFHSPHNAIFGRQRDGIEAALRARYGEQVEVFTAFTFVEGFLPGQVLPEIRRRGYRRLVIYPIEVVDSIFTGGLSLEQVNRALGDDPGWVQEMRYLPSFFDRPEYHRRLADHITGGIAPLRERLAPSQIGLVLLNHGCPLRAKGYETGIRESSALYRAVRQQLVQAYPSVSVGWMNHPTPGRWTAPNMEQAARNLIETGVRAVAFAPIGFVTENHETILDVGHVIDLLAPRHPDVEFVRLPSLNDDPAFLEMAAAWIAPLVEQAAGAG